MELLDVFRARHGKKLDLKKKNSGRFCSSGVILEVGSTSSMDSRTTSSSSSSHVFQFATRLYPQLHQIIL
jgi:hypothetical protein